MTDALIKCGAPQKIKPCVQQLWASYLNKIGVAYLDSPIGESKTNNVQSTNQEASIIPDWFSQPTPTEQESQDETEASDGNKSFLFAPAKV